MRFMSCRVAFVLIAVLHTLPATATIYYVSPTGNDTTGKGTLAAPFATPQRGINSAINPGDIVSIESGNYVTTGSNPPIVLKYSGSGATTAPGGGCARPITIEGTPGNTTKPYIRGVPGATGAGAIFAAGVSCVVVNNLELAGWGGSIAWPDAVVNAAQPGNRWSNLVYTDYGVVFSGTVAAATHHIILSNLYVHDFPGGGIGFNYGDYISVLGSMVLNNALYSPYEGSGLTLYENKNMDSTISTHNIISGNLFSGNTNLVPSRNLPIYMTSVSYAGVGQTFINVGSSAIFNYTQLVIDVPRGCIPPNTTVSFTDNGSSPANPFVVLSNAQTCDILSSETLVSGYATDGEGVIIDNTSETQTPVGGNPYASRTLIVNNVTTNNGGPGIQCGPVSAHCDIVFNTSYLDQAGAYNFNSSNAPGGIDVYQGSDMNIYNNIIYASPNVPAIWDQSSARVNWGNNLFFGGNNAHPIPGNNNVVALDPLFVAPTTQPSPLTFPSKTYFQLQTGSPAIGAGSTLFSRSVDFTGNPLAAGAPTDIGAYQAP